MWGANSSWPGGAGSTSPIPSRWPRFLARYGAAAAGSAPWLAEFPPEAVREWCAGLGQSTFVGSSGRVFPNVMKASPLLRAWIRRLEAWACVRHPRRVAGWDAHGALCFADGTAHEADAVVLALGGASWPRLGSDRRLDGAAA